MSTTPPAAQSTDDQPRLISDVAVMRALSHPARMALLEHLGHLESATATECAAVVGLSPSATSYHLRALAKVGLVEEAPGRGDGRERAWRATVHGYNVELPQDADEDTRDAERGLIDSFLNWETTRTRQYFAQSASEPPEWHRAAFMVDSSLMVTAEELGKIGEQFQEIIKPFRRRHRPDPPPGARPVNVLIKGFPTGEGL